jgi:Xaa-Pro aminopeptidase
MILKDKIRQAADILKEKKIDLWLTFVRESEVCGDPVLDLILGTSCTWQSAFMITASGRTIALVGSLDKANIESTGLYEEAAGYVAGIRDPLVEHLSALNPGKIAINYSESDTMADGLTHGMYLTLRSILEDTPFAERLVSSEKVIAALRGRKTPSEQASIQEAIAETEKIFDRVTGHLRPGLTEREVAAFMQDRVAEAGLKPAWDAAMCPAVFTGPESAGAHAGPTDRPMERGHLMNIDFGVRKGGYCSDLQRTWYFLKEGERQAPDIVLKAFHAVRDGIRLAAEAIRPGIEGYKIDAVARNHITGRGFEEYPHALGHQIGRMAHDGAGLLCPEWERYGTLPYEKIEAGQCYTLEPRVILDDYGVATLEEIIVVTEAGCRFLSTPQEEIYYIK